MTFETDLQPPDLAAARKLQESLRHRVIEAPPAGFAPRLVAGVDVHFSRDGTFAYAAAAVVDGATLELVESAQAVRPATFPYRTGFLSFREAPVALAALALLAAPFDLVMVDGQGRAHPRRCGLACHLGVLLDRPVVGVAKTRLIGSFAEPAPEPGSQSPLFDRDELIGAVLRTKARCRPLFVSVGHRIDLDRAVAAVLAFSGRYRLPEPTRLADRLSRAHG